MKKKLIGPATGYVDMLMYEIYENAKKQSKFQRTPIRPSAAGKCPRELYFELNQFMGKAEYSVEDMSAETLLLLNLGHHIERHLIDHFRKNFSVAEIKYTQQTLDFGEIKSLDDDSFRQHLEGSLDLCLVSKTFKCVIDVKSKGDSYDFKSRKYKWEADSAKLAMMKSVQSLSDRAYWVDNLDDFLEELKDPFFEANFLQLNMYLNSQFIKDRGLDHGAIIQYHKSKSKLREVRFRPSEKAFLRVKDKFQQVIDAVSKGSPDSLDVPYEPSSFKSRYCNFCKAKTPGSCAVEGKKKCD